MSLEKTKDREIKRDTRTGIYQFRGTIFKGGREIQRSLGVRTFNAAVTAKKDLLLRMRGLDPNARRILFRDYVKVFLEERKRKAPATYELAVYSTNHLLVFFDTHHVDEIREGAWAEYVAYQTQINPTRKLRYDRVHLKMMLNRLKRRGQIFEVPEFYYEDPGYRRRRALTAKEVETLLKHAGQSKIYGLILFMYKMGPRPGEVLGATWDEFDLVKGVWSLPAERVKTRQARQMKLNPTVWEWLLKRQARHKEKKVTSKYVFYSKGSDGKKPLDRYSKQWTRLIADAKLDKGITAYYLRHTFLSECAKRVRDGKLPLVYVTKYAGTSIEEFERTYLHVEGEETKSVADLMEAPL